MSKGLFWKAQTKRQKKIKKKTYFLFGFYSNLFPILTVSNWEEVFMIFNILFFRYSKHLNTIK